MGKSAGRFCFLFVPHLNWHPLVEIIPSWLLNYSSVTFHLSSFKYISLWNELSTQGVWVHKNETPKTKRSNWFSLDEIFETYFQTRLISVNVKVWKTSTVLCSYNFNFWEYTRNMGHSKTGMFNNFKEGVEFQCNTGELTVPTSNFISCHWIVVPLGF